MMSEVLMSESVMAEAIKRIAGEIVDAHGDDEVVLLGILSRGRPIAERIAENIEVRTGRRKWLLSFDQEPLPVRQPRMRTLFVWFQRQRLSRTVREVVDDDLGLLVSGSDCDPGICEPPACRIPHRVVAFPLGVQAAARIARQVVRPQFESLTQRVERKVFPVGR